MSDDVNAASVCRSDWELGDFLGSIQIDGVKGMTQLDGGALRAEATPDLNAQRIELINSVRAGKHVELAVTANTFKQRPGPNRRFLRLAADKLEARAPTWKGQPFLTDHNTYQMAASKGTILSSKLVQESKNVAVFEQVLNIVKPEAVIGVLDGTLRKFSIGWFGLGPVMCTAHWLDVRSPEGCDCWPGDTVLVDGKPKVVEYEFSDYEGKETSGVVVPAVRDTSITDYRAALSAELHLPPTRTTRTKEPRTMIPFPKLMAALSLSALTDADDGAAAAAVEGLRTRVAAAELDAGALRAANTKLTAELAASALALSGALTATTERTIADAYASGRLGYGKDAAGKNTPSELESLLRDYGKAAGHDALVAKIAKLPVVIPVGQRVLTDDIKQPAREGLSVVAGGADNPELANVASQLGLKVEDMQQFARTRGIGVVK